MAEGLQQRATRTSPFAGSSLTGTRLIPASLSTEQQEALESAALPSIVLKTNTDLVREGEAADKLYVMTEGWACRYHITRNGSRQIVALLLPGDVANLDTLMFERSSYGIRALSTARVVPIAREQVTALAREHDGIGKALLHLSLIENAILSQWAVCLGRQSAQQRLAHLLCELAVRVSRAGDDDNSNFVLPLTQEQLADVLGLTTVHVNRTIRQLQIDGLIVVANRSIAILDRAGLRHRAEFDPAYLHRVTNQADGLVDHLRSTDEASSAPVVRFPGRAAR